MRHANKSDLSDSGKSYKLIGSYLVEANLITREQLFQALEKQKISQAKLGDILVEQGSIEQKTLDYFTAKIIQPEQSESSYHNLLSSNFKKNQADSSFKTFDKTNKVLNLSVIKLSPAKVFSWLFVVVFFLVFISSLISLSSYYTEQLASIENITRLFKLDEEHNIPTLYSGLALGFCSVLLFIISNIKKQAKSKFVKHWQALSLIFLYLAIDEVFMIHEKFNFLREFVNAEGLLYYPWVIAGTAFVIVFLLVFYRLIQSLPKTTKNLFVLAGALYVGGAIGIEMIGAYYTEVYGKESFIYFLVSTLEEFLEMFGIIIFIYALLSYITRYLEVVNLQVDFARDKKLKRLGKS